MKRKEILDRMGLCLPQGKQIRVVISSDVSNEADATAAKNLAVQPSSATIIDITKILKSQQEDQPPQ